MILNGSEIAIDGTIIMPIDIGIEATTMSMMRKGRNSRKPILENPPLARALYGGVELDQEIPPEHYKVVAEIIGHVFRLQGKLRPR